MPDLLRLSFNFTAGACSQPENRRLFNVGNIHKSMTIMLNLNPFALITMSNLFLVYKKIRNKPAISISKPAPAYLNSGAELNQKIRAPAGGMHIKTQSNKAGIFLLSLKKVTKFKVNKDSVSDI